METQRINISELSCDPANVRAHDGKNLDAIKASLQRFGQQKPIVVDEKGVVIAGNGTLTAARALGWEAINIVRTELAGAEATAYAIADNRTAELAEWDDEALAKQLSALQIEDEALVEAAGFTDAELTALVDEVTGITEGNTDPDEVPEVPEEPTVQLGQIWQLGNHRIMCGDSTSAEDVAALMDGEKADMVFTDPPYSSGGFQESGKTSGSIGARGGVKIENDNLSTRGYMSLMDKVLGRHKSAHTVFIFCDWKMWATNQDVAEAKGYRVRNMIVWDKVQMGMGMPFRNQHELCLFGSKIAGKIGDGKTPNVIQCARDRESSHATPKPVELLNPLINQIPGKNIVDPFLGGGSTLISCEQTGRKCYGMELSPAYCDVIIKRWEDFTGQTAELVNG